MLWFVDLLSNIAYILTILLLFKTNKSKFNRFLQSNKSILIKETSENQQKEEPIRIQHKVKLLIHNTSKNFNKVCKELEKWDGKIEHMIPTRDDEKFATFYFKEMTSQITNLFYNGVKKRFHHPTIQGVPISMGNPKELCEKCDVYGHHENCCTEYFQKRVLNEGKELHSKKTRIEKYNGIYKRKDLKKNITRSRLFVNKVNNEKGTYIIWKASENQKKEIKETIDEKNDKEANNIEEVIMETITEEIINCYDPDEEIHLENFTSVF